MKKHICFLLFFFCFSGVAYGQINKTHNSFRQEFILESHTELFRSYGALFAISTKKTYHLDQPDTPFTWTVSFVAISKSALYFPENLRYQMDYYPSASAPFDHRGTRYFYEDHKLFQGNFSFPDTNRPVWFQGVLKKRQVSFRLDLTGRVPVLFSIPEKTLNEWQQLIDFDPNTIPDEIELLKGKQKNFPLLI